jgi:NADPH:quinone reductase-like Zn-dependent oxidoreductase
VLVTAASGGVGLYAVQLAKMAGLHVTATCGARNVELVRSLGASMRSPSGRKYDGVVHCTVGVGWSTFEPLLSGTGKLVDITASLSAFLRAALHRVTFARKRLVPLLLWPNKADLEFLVGLVKDGKLKTVVDSRFPLGEANKAWEKSIDGHATGKIIVDMQG